MLKCEVHHLISDSSDLISDVRYGTLRARTSKSENQNENHHMIFGRWHQARKRELAGISIARRRIAEA